MIFVEGVIRLYQYNNATIHLVLGDITKIRVDAIVNAANSRLAGGGGVDGAIHRVGGPAIMEECRKIGGCPTGEARITTAGNLPCKYVIHSVGPIYKDGLHGEKELLYAAYTNSLILALEHNVRTIAFPSISTGAYGYPIHEASKVAIQAVLDFLGFHEGITEVTFVLFNQRDFEIYQHLLDRIFA